MSLSVLVLLFFSSFTIRSSLPSNRSNSKEQGGDVTFHRNGLPDVAGRHPPVDLEMARIMGPEHVPSHRRVSSDVRSPAEGQPEEDRPSKEEQEKMVNLAKWKAAEIFKIAINYLQVIAIAVTVNVDWTDMLIEVFEAAGATTVQASQKNHSIASRDHWCGDV